MKKLLFTTLFLTSFATGQTLYLSGNNAAASEARKTFLAKVPKGCEHFSLASSATNAEYVMEIALDANGAANGTLSKNGNLVWSDSYDSSIYHYADRGKLNGKLLIDKFCYGVKKGKVSLVTADSH